MSFRVPNEARVRTGPMGSTDDTDRNGAFDVESPIPGWRLAIVASDGSDWTESGLTGEPWEHVSVHAYQRGGRKMRCPVWTEMCFVKRLFWGPNDIVLQFHPAESTYVNQHPFTLHLWAPTESAVQMPPIQCV